MQTTQTPRVNDRVRLADGRTGRVGMLTTDKDGCRAVRVYVASSAKEFTRWVDVDPATVTVLP